MMAKVFAVIKNNAGEFELLSRPSKARFESEYGWCDARFLSIGTTDDYKTGMFNEPEAFTPIDAPFVGYQKIRIVQDEERVNASNMIHEALKTHFKGKTFNK
ncbi:hypothetical protein ACNO5E_24515 [Vibrio parahaemolyticus]|uniref:hypothetical protein n=1 Tax=Vibrio parahaemolyticus TaxID=670 RepID=UPI0008131D7F|nr:hypothetical protein [Vibrio parahaemolyticus]OCP68422.1 hypothetical protein AKH08_16560 [Vibrio parahaemolyticus]